MSRAHQRRGIALLEVIVALVIVATFGAALFSWAGQTYRTANRAVELLDEAEIERNLIELSQAINPARQPQGKLQTELYVYDWQSQALRPPVNQIRHPMGLSPYQVGLYKVSLRVLRRADQALVLQRDLQLAGHLQTRAQPTGPFGLNP
ncbi:MAG TPA: type II secretion system protein [Roseateles sp.]|uniref:type II secretion system protein n=1 Tax=Roseateles sp. TaxID=1971397 RepID=UPI002EDB20FF